MIGRALGPYQVLSKLGEGGMGEVYRARDTKLDRDVALKILPASFASDPDRLMRFEREAKTLAALNHPNIAAIYGVGEEAVPNPESRVPNPVSVSYLVMELVEGRDLSEVIAGGIPLDDALAIARQIADALEAAHEQGIVHRDLKPANIKVRDDGTVKVLDFGLAKALVPEGAGATADAMNSPTMTSPALTAMGLILGTAAYMAPEQAKGRPVDKRADIWAFGVVLYEMLTGRRAFAGEDVSETLAAVLTREVDLSALPAGTPPAVTRLIGRCLTRDPRKRLRDLGDARLDEIEMEEAAPQARQPRRRWAALLPWAAGLAGMAVVWGVTRPAPGEAPPLVRSTIELPDGFVLAARDRAVALSPDGTQLAVVLVDTTTSRRQLYVRRLDKLDLRPLAGTDEAAYPFWSPDGRSVGFFAADELRRIDLPDGPVRKLAPAIQGRGASWGDDGRIVFAAARPDALQFAQLYAVPEGGGVEPVEFLPDDQNLRDSRLPLVLPGGAGVIFGSSTTERTYALAPGSREPREILPFATEVQYVHPGWLTFVREELIMAQRFDLRTLTLQGDAEVAGDSVRADRLRFTGHVTFAAASGRAMVYEHEPPLPLRQLEWADRQGRRLQIVGEPGTLGAVSISPDATRAVVRLTDTELWMVDLATGVRSPFHAEPDRRVMSPVWSPEGRSVAFSLGGRLAIQAADGRPGSRREVDTSGFFSPTGWTPDGASVIGSLYSTLRGSDLAIVPADGTGKPVLLFDTPATEDNGTLSPDGRWLAFTSEGSTLYVTAYPGLGRTWPVSGDRVDEVWWAAANEIQYRELSGRLSTVAFRTAGGFPEVGVPEPLFGDSQFMAHGIDRARGRFLASRQVGRQRNRSLVIVSDWSGGLGR